MGVLKGSDGYCAETDSRFCLDIFTDIQRLCFLTIFSKNKHKLKVVYLLAYSFHCPLGRPSYKTT